MPSGTEPPAEVILTGGNIGCGVRVGDAVRRKTGPWTPAEVADHIHVRMGAACERIAAGQRAGDAGMLNPARIGEPAATVAAAAAYAQRLPLLRVEADPRLG